MAIHSENKNVDRRTGDAKAMAKHQVLTQELRQLVQAMRPDDRFPTQVELMRRFGVSDRTVLRSLDDLCREGLLVRRQGSGTFVSGERSMAFNTPSSTAGPGSILAVISMQLSKNGFYEACFDNLTSLAGAAGLSVINQVICSADELSDTKPLEAASTRAFLIFGYKFADIARRLIGHGYRAVVVGSPLEGDVPNIPNIYPDQEVGGFTATKHLIDLGHRRLAYLEPDLSLSQTRRWSGHKRAIDQALRAGIIVHEEIITGGTELSWREQPEEAVRYFRAPNGPTGILTWNDDFAITTLATLQRAGLRVPEDVSLVGFDKLTVGQNSYPRITTLDTHAPRVAELAFEMLTSDAPLGQREVVLVPELVVGESSTRLLDAS